MDIGLSVGVAAIDGVKALIKLIREKQKADPELLSTVNEIMSDVLDMRGKYLELYQENEKLKREATIEASITFDSNFGVYRGKDEDQGMAYCTKCKSTTKTLVPLKQRDHGYFCAACGTFYDDPGYVHSDSGVKGYWE